MTAILMQEMTRRYKKNTDIDEDFNKKSSGKIRQANNEFKKYHERTTGIF